MTFTKEEYVYLLDALECAIRSSYDKGEGFSSQEMEIFKNLHDRINYREETT